MAAHTVALGSALLKAPSKIRQSGCFRPRTAPQRTVLTLQSVTTFSIPQKLSQAAAAVVLSSALLVGGAFFHTVAPAQRLTLQVRTKSSADNLPRFLAGADARWEGVNKPELLPKEFTPVIDLSGQLTAGEVRGEAHCGLSIR